jgi:protein-tyrosine phosphatase
MKEEYSRHLRFKSVINFRDLGGYQTRSGRTVAWRRVFRSGEFSRITREDYQRLKEEIKLATIIDLRSDFEVKRQGPGLLAEAGVKYHNVPFIPDGSSLEADVRRFRTFNNMGQFYLDIIRDKGYGKRINEAMEIIAGAENHPLVFHCAIGKDRTGILAAMLLSLVGVPDEDIIEDYTLSGPYMEELLKQINSDPKTAANVPQVPDYFWTATPESMELLLTTLRKEYGSIPDYLESMGSTDSLIERLEKALLI